ncbi:MAG: integrase core domain-containing protein [Cyclobacteriaceae bacterium]|nr:integrase core domain-containing protein [Cyclobacteriaceae bacterium]
MWAIHITYIPDAKRLHVSDGHYRPVQPIYRRLAGVQFAGEETQTMVLEEAIRRHGKPEIVNSDQGSQYTSAHWVDTLKDLGIQISMDGRGRATDNAFIERWFRTIKQKYIYLNPENNGLDLYHGVDTFVGRYNRRNHQGIGRRKPVELYLMAA